MSEENIRVEIAKDALKLLEAKSILPTSGYYVSFKQSNIFNEEDISGRELVEKTTCSTCALGALFVSTITRLNSRHDKTVHIYLDQAFGTISKPEVMGELTKYFSEEQLKLIEIMYELWPNILTNNCLDTDVNKDAMNYLAEFSSLVRLTIILKNIIKNGGEFKPETIRIKEKIDESSDSAGSITTT